MADVHDVISSPRLDLRDVLVRGRWQQAVFLTYSFDLPFFESFILPTLVMNGCRSISVAACASWLPDGIRTWAAAGEIREAGQSYTLSGVSLPGVFHPKLILAAGTDGGIAMVGSGNVSQYGMATGGELFTVAEWGRDETPPPLALESWQLCREVGRRLPVDPVFADGVEALGRLAPILASPVAEPVLVHNLNEPILDQFLRLTADDSVKEVIAWSPFTDKRLDALDALVARTRPDLLILGVQADVTKLDGTRLLELQKRHPGVTWEIRALHHGPGMRAGMIHAKGVLLSLASGNQMALIGSPNLSRPALLQTVASGNFEVAAVHRSRELRESLFGRDTAIVLGDIADIDRLKWQEDPTTTGSSAVLGDRRLLGVRNRGQWLDVELRGPPPEGSAILLDGTTSLALKDTDGTVGCPIGNVPAPRTAELVWPGGTSGPVVVHDLAQLMSIRRAGESRRHTPLEAIDYGADTDILALLDELARLAIVSVSDVSRAVGGMRAPTPEEEAAEADGEAPAVPLDDIDFSQIRQHPRAHAYDRSAASLDAPRVVLWLDEVVRQFEWLREGQLLRVVRPIDTDEGDEEPQPVDERLERPQWSTSRRVRLLVRNRLRRGVTGMADPRFWRVIDPLWMAMNYGLWLGVLDRLWRRALTAKPILRLDDLGLLTSDLLAGYWGDDRRSGYFAQVDEETRRSSTNLLAEHHIDALTVAACLRLLETVGGHAESAQFVIGTYVKVAEPFGFVDEEVVERALVFLDRPEAPAAAYRQRLLAARNHFSWDRFTANLVWRHNLPSASVHPNSPGRGGFISGSVLVVGGTEYLPASPATLPAFAEWVQEVRRREPRRDVVQMVWGGNLILFYDVVTQQLLTRPGLGATGASQRRIVAVDVLPEDIGTLSMVEQLDASA